MNYEMILKDYEYQQERIVNKISSKESIKPTLIKVTGILRLPCL